MKKVISGALIALVLFAGLFGSIYLQGSQILPAYAALPTPLPFNQTVDQATTGTFFDRAPLAANTRQCLTTLARNSYGEIQYVIDQGTVANSTTLSMQSSNDSRTFEDGTPLVSGNTVDGHAMLRVPLMGRYNCVNVRMTSTRTVTVTAILNGK